MNRICVLSEETINQIAAGEVIENPASVVKELVENAIDAGSKRVTVEIKGGGFQLIRVIDEGFGMSPKDALLCFERHATSKIRATDDLLKLNTLGFRGEAISSIASVSEFLLMTALENSPGTRIENHAGRILSIKPFARSRGTTIEVRALFYNVPARKKFQKSVGACVADIHRLLSSFSLAHPEIGFKFINQDKEVFSVSEQEEDFLVQLTRRMQKVLNESYVENGFKVEGKKEGYELKGYLGSSLEARQNRTGQFFFINRRAVSCSLVSLAVKESFATILSLEKHPFYVLHLMLPSHLVDVNVHPQKREVRFQEEVFLKNFVQEQVAEALHGKVNISSFPFNPHFSQNTYTALRFKEEEDLPADFFSEKDKIDVMALFQNFLLIREKEGILWIDLCAVQEKIALEGLKKREEKSSQFFLIPLVLQLPLHEARELEARLEEFAEMGFKISLMSKGAFSIETAPHFISEEEVKGVILKILQNKGEGMNTISFFARSVKTSFSLQEAIMLAKKALQFPRDKKSSWGKKMVVFMEKNEIEKLFKI